MDKIRVFVGSSVGGLSHARAVKQNLDYDAWVRLWNQGIFRTGSYPVDDLIAALDDADFGAFIFLPEDILILNRQGESVETKAVRDNVVFELGMFVGRLGRDRVFMIKPRGQELHLPSDLSGVNLSDFNDDPNLHSALGAATDAIRTRIQQLGPKAAARESHSPATPRYPERPLNLEDLHARPTSGAATYPVVLPDRKVIQPPIAELIKGVDSPRPKLKLFLSYSHRDEKGIGQLRQDLKLMERNGLIHTRSDHALTVGEQWEGRILQELTEADIVVCQLSRDFLASDFCVLKELETAIQRKQRGEAELFAYVLEECGWKEVPKLAKFQILPTPLPERRTAKAKYWRTVAEELQKTIARLCESPRPESRR